MSDNLEKFIRQNREQFDKKSPREGLWQKIDAKLPEGGGPQIPKPGNGPAGGFIQKFAAWKIAASIVAGVVLVGAVWLISSLFKQDPKDNFTDKTNGKQTFTENLEKPFIDPPLPAAAIPFQSLSVDALAGGDLNLDNGTRIHFPASTFIHPDGRPVEGKVEIRYREFHDAADIILSGIPMTYDNNGKTEIFETAGMIEILGFQNDKPVQIAPGKQVSFELATAAQENNYNFYYLDPAQRRWTDLNKPKLRSKQRYATDSSMAVEFEAAPVAPRKPVGPETLKGAEEIGFAVKNVGEFPELKPFQNIRWIAKDPDYLKRNQWIFTKKWTDIRIQEIPGDQMVYNMVLKNKSGTFTLPALPVLSGQEYEKAMADFRKQKARYDNLLQQRKNQDRRREAESDMIYAFNISKFGTFNCDRFVEFVNAKTMKASFDFGSDEYADTGTQIFQVITDRSVRTLQSASTPQNVAISTKQPQFFVALLSSGEVAMATPIEVNTLMRTAREEITIPLKATGKVVRSSKDLKELLNI